MESQLFNAIDGQCDIKVLQKILAKIENINMRNKFGETALAAMMRTWIYSWNFSEEDFYGYSEEVDKYNYVKAVQLFVDAGADVNLKNRDGQSVIEALITSASEYQGHKLFEILKILIKAGGNVNSKNEHGETMLHLAIKDKHILDDFIEFLLQQDGIDVDSQDQYGLTPLNCLLNCEIVFYREENVQCFIDAGAGINLDDCRGHFLLHWAAEALNLNLIKYLITLGADVNAIDSKTGRTPLHCLMYARDFYYGDDLAEALEVLLSAGADVNAAKISSNWLGEISHGDTPLHIFIYSQYVGSCYKKFTKINATTVKLFLKILKIFIKYGADFKIKNSEDESPMDIFLNNYFLHKNLKNMTAMLETFIKCGMLEVDSLFTLKWFEYYSYCSTILHDSCYDLNYKMIKFLVNYGANIDVVDDDMDTPLLMLIQKLTDSDGTNHGLKILDYFLSLNPDVNAIADEGYHILNFDDYWGTEYPEFLWKALIQYIAKKQSTGYLLHDSISQTISGKIKYETYLDECTEELKSLQELKLPWVNLYDILMDRKKKLDCYAKNKEFTREFTKLWPAQRYPIYGPSIVKRFSKAIQKQEIMEKSAVILSSCLPCHLDPCHLILRKIISYLKVKYLRYLGEPDSEEIKKKIKMEELQVSFDKYFCNFRV